MNPVGRPKFRNAQPLTLNLDLGVAASLRERCLKLRLSLTAVMEAQAQRWLELDEASARKGVRAGAGKAHPTTKATIKPPAIRARPPQSTEQQERERAIVKAALDRPPEVMGPPPLATPKAKTAAQYARELCTTLKTPDQIERSTAPLDVPKSTTVPATKPKGIPPTPPDPMLAERKALAAKAVEASRPAPKPPQKKVTLPT